MLFTVVNTKLGIDTTMLSLFILSTVMCMLCYLPEYSFARVFPTFETSQNADRRQFQLIRDDGIVVFSGDMGSNTKVERDGECYQFSAVGESGYDILEDCFDLGFDHWYGGPEQLYQYWPIEQTTLDDYSYIVKSENNQGIAERYWLSSSGVYIHVHDRVPLFIDMNSKKNNTMCFIAKSQAPYRKLLVPVLLYSVCAFRDAREAHQHAIETVLGKPSGIPDERMFQHPIWSTWARYKVDVNETAVLTFASEILEYGFNNSQLEIDDNWEVCYGSLTWNETKFPRYQNLISILKKSGFHVTLWVHPFVNLDCKFWYAEALQRGYLVQNLDGSVVTGWWNGAGSHIDFTNPEAVEWYTSRLRELIASSGVDSFKFDAGESSWLPQLPLLNLPWYQYPNGFTSAYLRTVAEFGSKIEVRLAQGTQNLPIFVRMNDKYSIWDIRNGLKTLVTTLLQMNLAGYPFVLPDMIGGNGYGNTPSKELFIRWLQANVFMPSLQFSYVPWDYDVETITITRKYTALHTEYSGKIIELAKKATQDGSPINPPIWWIDPTDQIALGIWDEFLLGEDILVAPILDEGATRRDVYLPAGQWLYHSRGNPINGPIWLRNLHVPLYELLYFTRISSSTIS